VLQTIELKMQTMRSTLSWLQTLPPDEDIIHLADALQTFVADVEPIVQHLTGAAA